MYDRAVEHFGNQVEIGPSCEEFFPECVLDPSEDITDAAGLVLLIAALHEYFRWIPEKDLLRRIRHLLSGDGAPGKITGFPGVAWDKLPHDYPGRTGDHPTDVGDLLRWAKSRMVSPLTDSGQLDGKADAIAQPSSQLLSPDETAALSDTFVKHVGDYLDWEKIKNLTARSASSSQPAEKLGEKLVEYDGRVNEEGAWLRENSPVLAAALERYGYDSSAVLRVARCAGRSGGGPAFVAPTWEETKIGLQRAAIWLRCQLAPGDIDRKFMERAVEEARKSRTEDGRIHPKVGVVIVKDGKELAVAYRGELDKGEHAEFTALERKLPDVEIAGATVYTTLEPCTTQLSPTDRNALLPSSHRHLHPPLVCRLTERVQRTALFRTDTNKSIQVLVEDGKGHITDCGKLGKDNQ